MKKKTGLRLLSMLILVGVLSLSAGLTGALSAAGAAEKLPEGEDICDRYADVCGGRAAFDKLKNRKLTAVFEIPAQGLVLDMIVYAQRPNTFYSKIESPVLGKIEKGVSPKGVVWEISTMQGPSVKEGVEKTTTLRDSQFDRLIDWRKAYVSAVTTGMEKVGESECYLVEMTPEEGNALTFYYEKQSGLLTKIRTVNQTEMGDIPTEIYMVEHREIDGVLLPWKISINSMGSERVITNKEVEHNIEIPDGTFDLPGEIRAMLEN